MGEQGAEQIHSHFKKLEMTYSGITDPLERLQYIMHEHMLQTAPSLSSLQPSPPKKTKVAQ